MTDDQEIRINARGLSSPGPRMMVENALGKGRYELVRVVVSSQKAVNDLREYFAAHDAAVTIDQVGEEWHVLADFREYEGSID